VLNDNLKGIEVLSTGCGKSCGGSKRCDGRCCDCRVGNDTVDDAGNDTVDDVGNDTVDDAGNDTVDDAGNDCDSENCDTIKSKFPLNLS
jgi:hypothetical protein